jgi:hypothetical protein
MALRAHANVSMPKATIASENTARPGLRSASAQLSRVLAVDIASDICSSVINLIATNLGNDIPCLD